MQTELKAQNSKYFDRFAKSFTHDFVLYFFGFFNKN